MTYPSLDEPPFTLENLPYGKQGPQLIETRAYCPRLAV